MLYSVANRDLYFTKFSGDKYDIVSRGKYRIGKTTRGGPKIFCGGYSYVHQLITTAKTQHGKLKHWKCSGSKSCRAKAKMTEEGDLLLKGQHCHPPSFGILDLSPSVGRETVVGVRGDLGDWLRSVCADYKPPGWPLRSPVIVRRSY